MSETVYECLSEIDDPTTNVNICNKDRTILFYDQFKDILFDLVCEYLKYNVIEVQRYYDPIEDKFIIFIVINK